MIEKIISEIQKFMSRQPIKDGGVKDLRPVHPPQILMMIIKQISMIMKGPLKKMKCNLRCMTPSPVQISSQDKVKKVVAIVQTRVGAESQENATEEAGPNPWFIQILNKRKEIQQRRLCVLTTADSSRPLKFDRQNMAFEYITRKCSLLESCQLHKRSRNSSQRWA